jgi:murein DD-endopeptidase MepM/ murein hydrolase activator NlpD
MPTSPALRRVLLVLSVAGSLVPGASLRPSTPPTAAPPPVTSARAPTGVVGPGALRGTWSWPLAPRPHVLAPYVAPASTYGPGHRGIDVAAAQGHDVHAVDAGVVTHVGVIAGRGTLSVTHASGLRSTYEPVRGIVGVGSRVSEGQVIGSIEGRSHCGSSCLHLGALVGSAYLDPRPLLGGGPVILLPLGGQPAVGHGF